MEKNLADRIENSMKFKELVFKKTRLSWQLSITMLVIYYGFIVVIAFYPQYLGRTISDSSVITVGIPIGIGVIISAFALTWVYVRRANTAFDQITRELIEEVRQ